MSNETAAVAETTEKSVSGGRKKHDEHGHLTDFGYVTIFITLAVITAVEVAWSYIPGIPTPIFIIGLFAMMVWKFYLVAAEFMHLKYEQRFNTLFFLGSFLFVGVFVGYTLNDTDHRGDDMYGRRVDPATGNYAYGTAESISQNGEFEALPESEEEGAAAVDAVPAEDAE